MGFDMGVTSRAADHFGADEKQVSSVVLCNWFLSRVGVACPQIEIWDYFQRLRAGGLKFGMVLCSEMRDFPQEKKMG